MGMYHQNMDGSGTPGQVSTPIRSQGPAAGPSPVSGSGPGPGNVPTGPAAARLPPGVPQAAFRGRGMATPPLGMRGRGGFPRGRGRGGMYIQEGGQ